MQDFFKYRTICMISQYSINRTFDLSKIFRDHPQEGRPRYPEDTGVFHNHLKQFLKFLLRQFFSSFLSDPDKFILVLENDILSELNKSGHFRIGEN